MSCIRAQHGSSRETQTNDPFISSRALYHWLALQVLNRRTWYVLLLNGQCLVNSIFMFFTLISGDNFLFIALANCVRDEVVEKN